MSNGHAPRHNNVRRDRLANHTPLRDRLRRRTEIYFASWPRSWWVRLSAALAAALAVTLIALAVTVVRGEGHGGHAHAAQVRYVVDQHCLEALSHAETAMDDAEKFGANMQDFHAGALALFQRGDAGRPVKHLQRWLNERGADLEVDGSYGSDTQAAVEAYRQEHGKHSERSKTYLAELADTREAYAAAAEQCRGGAS